MDKLILDDASLEERRASFVEYEDRIEQSLDTVEFPTVNDSDAKSLPRTAMQRSRLAEEARDASNGKVHPALAAKRICDAAGRLGFSFFWLVLVRAFMASLESVVCLL